VYLPAEVAFATNANLQVAMLQQVGVFAKVGKIDAASVEEKSLLLWIGVGGEVPAEGELHDRKACVVLVLCWCGGTGAREDCSGLNGGEEDSALLQSALRVCARAAAPTGSRLWLLQTEIRLRSAAGGTTAGFLLEYFFRVGRHGQVLQGAGSAEAWQLDLRRSTGAGAADLVWGWGWACGADGRLRGNTARRSLAPRIA
jgi:hypothetical protein